MSKLPALSKGTTGFYNERNEWQCTGSQMGRRDTLPDDRTAPCKLRLVRLRWVDGDYDAGGAYWGNSGGTSTYRALGDAGEVRAEIFVRASSRDDAKAQVRALLPNVRFYN